MTNAFAVLDIHRRADGVLPEEVIRTAYKASRRLRIALLLDADVSAADVDLLLDPLVKQCRLDIPGLVYVRSDQPPCESGAHPHSAERQGIPTQRRTTRSAAAIAMLARLARATRCDEAIGA
ncbi:hypothetical protein EAH87_15655 [Sphingomonas koreensis]|nr:hypothetical protein EAH87_15655 [Sphingomonas koreensis]